jgi:hypothetical protein
MSRKQLVFLVSRAFALLLFVWTFAEITYLPERFYALRYHLNQAAYWLGRIIGATITRLLPPFSSCEYSSTF